MKRFLFSGIMIVLASAVFAQTSGGPDAYGYTWKNSNHTVTPPAYQWFDISQIGMEVGGLGDDNVVGPFTAIQGFQYYWYPVNQFWIGSNGFITFNGDNIASPFPTAIPLATGANNWIAPLMGDLNFAGTGNTAKCYYWSNSDTLCVSWLNVPFYTNNAVGYSGSNSFQVILNKADKSITFNYQSTNIGQGTLDLAIGIENSTGTLGLGPYLDVLPAGSFTIKFYYPTTVTYAVTDGGMNWNGNNTNGGIFVKKGAPVNLQANVRNFGNQVLGGFSVVDTVYSNIMSPVSNGTVAVPGLAVQNDTTVVFPNQFTAPAAGTYRFNTRVTGITGDMVAANNAKTQEIIAIDTTLASMVLDYSSGVASGGGLGWTGGNGGIGVYIAPPKYPVRITGSRFLISSNTSSAGFYAKIYRDDGPDKSPGSLLDSVFVSGLSIVTGVYTSVPVSNPNIYIDSGGVYLLWYMGGADINIGRDNTPPISYRTYEVLFNIWSDYRDKFSEDFCVGLDLTYPAPFADFTVDASNDPTFSFTDESIYSPTTWSWAFGDGDTSSLQNPTHTYTSMGQFNVCLTVTNSYGTHNKCKTITVSNGAPVAMFTYDASAMPGVQFTDASGGTPTQWKWNFDDVGADSSNQQNPMYYFNTNGNHNVCLIVSNAYGVSPPYCQTVMIWGIGVEDISSAPGIKVFPNPSTDRLQILLEGYDGNYTPELRVYTVTGERISVDYHSDGSKIELLRGSLSNGMYLFEVYAGHDRLANGRFIVR